MIALLHGFAGTRASWDAVRADLTDAIAIALPGHEGPPCTETWHACVAQVGLALRQAGADASTLVVGYSMGGRLALGLLDQGYVGRIVVISAHPGLATAHERATRKADDDRWIEVLHRHGMHGFLQRWAAQPLFASQRDVPHAISAARQAGRTQLNAANVAHAMNVLGLSNMPNYRAMIQKHARQITWIVGALDTKFLHIATQLRVASSALALHVVEGAGHDVPFENAPAVAELIRRVYVASPIARTS